MDNDSIIETHNGKVWKAEGGGERDDGKRPRCPGEEEHVGRSGGCDESLSTGQIKGKASTIEQ